MPHKGYKQSKEHKQKISENHKRPWLGKKHSDECKMAISKAKKGKKLSEDHKQKIRKSCQSSFILTNKKCSYGKQGYYNGIYYDSSYELHFMQLLDEYKIPYERADNKKFRVKYFLNNQEHYYYPDFYLPREGSIVEIKSSYRLQDPRTQIKLKTAKEKYGKQFLIITEKELPELLQ